MQISSKLAKRFWRYHYFYFQDSSGLPFLFSKLQIFSRQMGGKANMHHCTKFIKIGKMVLDGFQNGSYLSSLIFKISNF